MLVENLKWYAQNYRRCRECAKIANGQQNPGYYSPNLAKHDVTKKTRR